MDIQLASDDDGGGAVPLDLRSRVELYKGSGDWQEVHVRKSLPASRTAILICDMWDQHWCKSAARRVAEMAGPLEETLTAARSRGVFIIHAPSTVTAFYKDTPKGTWRSGPLTQRPRSRS